MTWTPACMTADELAAWTRLAVRAGGAVRPCADCPARFEREMRSAGRCNGTERIAERRRRQAVERTREWKAQLRADVEAVRRRRHAA